jgi:hypothetical protein
MVAYSVLSWGSILWCSQNGNDPLEDLAKFGDKLNLKIRIFEYPSTIFGYILEPWI